MRLKLVGVAMVIYGLLVLIGAAIACPKKHASIPVSLFMVLNGLCFISLARELEKIEKRFGKQS